MEGEVNGGNAVPHLYKKYVKGTEKDAIVQSVQALLCDLTSAVVKGVRPPCARVYVSTRVIKHIYDKRPAEEFDFLVSNVYSIARYPDRIYRNKPGKRGEYCFVKAIKNHQCLCSIETV